MFPSGIVSRGSFKRQITLTFVVGFFFLASTFAVYIVESERAGLYRENKDTTTGLTQSLAVSSRSWVLAKDVVGLQEVVSSFRDYPELRYAMVISSNGQVLAHSDATKVGQFLADEQSLALINVAPGNRTLRDDQSIIDIAIPILLGKQHVGWARIALGRENIAGNLRKMILKVSLFVLLSTVLSLLAAVFVVNRLGRRIGSLVTVAQEVQAGNYAMRVEDTSAREDEITKLANSLNLMLDTLGRNEEQLRSSSLYTRSLIEASLDPLVTISSNGIITDVNRATESATGRNRSELIGTDFSDCFAEPDKARRAYQQAFMKGFVSDFPLLLRHRDGHVTQMLYNASVYKNENDEVLGVFASARDVTEHKRAEVARSRLASIVESSSDAIIGKTLDGIITSWNKGAEKIYGHTADEIVGKPITTLAPPFLHAEILEILEKVGKGGSVTNYESERIRKDGTRFHVALTLSPIRDDSGSISGISTIARDITERKLAEKALQRLNRELRAVSSCNQTLMHADDEQTLLKDICYLICEQAGYRMAWVGYAENDEAKTIRPVTWAGVEDGYLAQAGITWADTERGRGPAGTTIRSGKSTCIQDFSTDLLATPWHDSALQRGYRSCISLPLKDKSTNTFGILTIYSTEPNAFTPDEVRLLEELAGDLAFGITVLRARIELRRAGSIMQARLRLLEFAGSHSMDELLTATLDEIEELTGSVIGFYHFVEADQKTLTLHSWSTNTIKNMCTAEGAGSHYGVDQAGVWADCVRERRSIIHNDYASLPNRKRMPEGHAEVVREAVVPIFRGDQIMAIIGVGNKAANYDESDIEIVSQLGDLSWDVAERKRVEENLRQMNERFSLSTRAAHMGVWDWDLKKNELVWDNGMYELYGVKRDDFSGAYDAWLKGIHPDDREASDRISKQAQRGEREYNTEFRVVWPDGSIHYLKAYGQFVRDRDGNPLRMTGVNFDITELKVANEALRESEDKYRTLIQKIQVAVVVHGADTQIVTCNSMAQELLGLTQDQLLGKTAVDPAWHFFREDGTVAPLEEYPVSRVLASRKAIRNLILGVHRPHNENDVWVLVNADPVFDKADELSKIIITFIDITERKQVELLLHASEEEFRTLAENSPDVIVRYDREGRRIYVNPEFERVNHLTSQQVVGKTPAELSTELKPKADVFTEKLMAALATGTVAKVDLSWIKDGKPICWFVRVIPEFDSGGKVVSALTIWSDISERKQAEEEIRKLNQELEQRVTDRTAQLESANKELEAFSYSVSHDLRTPLRAIDGYSHILLEDYADTLDTEGKRLLGVVRANTSRMAQLIDDILKFSRTGRVEITFAEIDMEGMAREVVEELQSSLAGTTPQFEIERLPRVKGDRAMMRQVFVNLLTNAIKFSRYRKNAQNQGGRLHLGR